MVTAEMVVENEKKVKALLARLRESEYRSKAEDEETTCVIC